MVYSPGLPPDAGEGKPLVFDLRRFALDDGPGLRTTVFLKGCPLSCVWCQNPESINPQAEIVFHPTLCIQCGTCVEVCPEGAARLEDAGRILREQCVNCGICAEQCPSTALKIAGKHYPAHKLVEEVLKDRVFYETSGGGVTLSGGEPAFHMDYVSAVMRKLKEHGFHIAIQTCGLFDLKEFRIKLLPHLDLIYYDIKLFDSGEHRKFTGAGNSRILDNFIALTGEVKDRIVPRTPLIPNITATEENLRAITNFISSTGCDQYELLPYNPGAIGKMRAVGRPVPEFLPRIMMSPEGITEWKTLTAECLRKSRL